MCSLTGSTQNRRAFTFHRLVRGGIAWGDMAYAWCQAQKGGHAPGRHVPSPKAPFYDLLALLDTWMSKYVQVYLQVDLYSSYKDKGDVITSTEQLAYDRIKNYMQNEQGG